VKTESIDIKFSVILFEKEFKTPPNLDIPLREFIKYIPQDKMVMYYGSMTEPGCTENVTWLINLRPHVILPEQVKQLKSLLSTKSIPDLNEKDGGNYRDIQTLSEGRKVYSFDN